MNKTAILKRALAIGRRVMLALLALVAVVVATAWWLAPDIKTLRPQIESYLQQELELQGVELGWLNWYWAGHIGITSDACSFRTHDGAITVKGSRISVYFSTWNLLRGNFLPESILLHDGDIALDFDLLRQSNGELPPVSLGLDNMHLNWRVGNYRGEVAGLFARLEGEEVRRLQLRFPGAQGKGVFGADGLPEKLELSFLDVAWLPEQLKSCLSGQIEGGFSIRRSSNLRWQGEFRLASDSGAALRLAAQDFALGFEELDGEAQLELVSQSETASLKRIDLKRLAWRLGKNRAEVNGQWHVGLLQLAGSATHIEMPQLWSWLRPLGEDAWDSWLASMKSGAITRLHAGLSLVWADPMRALPTDEEWQSLRYQVKATVDDADVALGTGHGAIVHSRAEVELDQQGLVAHISHTELPEIEGAVSGTLRLPWNTTVLDITGSGDVDMALLHAWMDAEDAKALQWSGKAPATGSFSLVWMPEEEQPRDMAIRLQPRQEWQLKPNGIAVRVRSGTVEWRMQEGLRLRDLAVATPHFGGTLSAQAVHAGGQWRLTSFAGNGRGALAPLVAYFHLPVEAPAGEVAVELGFGQQWSGHLDFADSSWANMLGTAKGVGTPMRVRFSGEREVSGFVRLGEIICDDKIFRLRGSGGWSTSGLKLNLERVETAMFNGSMAIKAPFGPEPWELDINASYLSRKALPQALAKVAPAQEKPWALRASIRRFDWDDARMEGVSIRLASSRNSVGVFKADSIQTETLRLDRVSAMFVLPGGGKVDLRQFAASLDQLNLSLSSTLTPAPDGGVRWRGYATLEGNFGDMMERAGVAGLFKAGDMHVLFSGQGELLRNQPWWQGLVGRLRLRVNDGHILKGGTLTKLLAAVNIMELPALFTGDRKDLTEKGLFYRRMQSEAVLRGKHVAIREFALRSSAMDIAGHGSMDIEAGDIDMTLVARPFQNLDALLAKVPLVRDLFGGSAHSLIRRVYHMHGPIEDATVEEISPEEAGLAAPGVVEHLLGLPSQWFGGEKEQRPQ